METYKPIMEREKKIVKFSREHLETLLEKLDKSGAQEIGVELELV